MTTWLETCNSTNAVARENSDRPHGWTVATRTQTAGRGQRGNSWEAEPGKNLTFTTILHPGIHPGRQFALSMAVATAVAQFVSTRTGCRATVKWPNDIYCGNSKIAGILIEHIVSGPAILTTLVGIGLNVNQTVFRSDAPNPVSMAQITGHTYDLPILLEDLVNEILAQVDRCIADENPEDLQYLYHSLLYRNDGLMHPYRDCASGEEFEAVITSVFPDGRLNLTDAQGGQRKYYFKEVAYL